MHAILRRLRRRPSPSMVVALLALFAALDGPATAARLIDGRAIRHGSIGTKQIRDRSLQTMDLTRHAVRSLQRTAPYSVNSRQLAPKAVDASKIGDAAVGPTQLAAGAVTASKLADGSVGAGAIADGTLQSRDIGDFYGAVSVDFKAFDDEANRCQVAKDIVPQPAAPGQANAIADDVVLVSPSAGWPDPIIVTANPGAGNTLRIVACRVGQVGSGAPSIDPGPTVFQYVAIDQP